MIMLQEDEEMANDKASIENEKVFNEDKFLFKNKVKLYKENILKNLQSDISHDHLDKKKILDEALNKLGVNSKGKFKSKDNTQCDFKYDVSKIIRKTNLSYDKKIQENEEKAFKFLDEFCEMKYYNDDNVEIIEGNADNLSCNNNIIGADPGTIQMNCDLQEANYKVGQDNINTILQNCMEDESANYLESLQMEDKNTKFKKSAKNTKKRQITGEISN